MILALDVGNSYTSIGLFTQEGSLVHTWKRVSDVTCTKDELRQSLIDLFSRDGLDITCVHDAALACVVPALTDLWADVLKDIISPRDALIINAQNTGEMGVAVDMPQSVGADRLANAYAARTLYGYPSMVVDFGTATNIDTVNKQGDFCGGAIMPGVMVAAEALFARAAKLTHTPLEVPREALGKNTTSAIQSGMILGHLYMIEGLVQQITREMKEPHVPVIATGGCAPLMSAAAHPFAQTRLFDHIDTNLTIRGVFYLWRAHAHL